MIGSYLKMAFKVLVRRKFFTAISLFGIGFTLMILTLGAGLLDVAVAPGEPEVHLDRTLFFSNAIMTGSGENHSQWWSAPGYRLLDHYMRDLPGVELYSISSEPIEVASFIDGRKLELQARFVDAPFWRIHQFSFLEGGPFTAEDERDGNLVAVISATARAKYFGKQPALDHVVEFNQLRYRVVGVVEDVPIHRLGAYAQILVPLSTFPNRDLMENLMGGFVAILLAHSRADFPRIREEFQARLKQVEFPQPERYSNLYGRLTTRWEERLSGIGDVGGDGELKIHHELPKLLAVAAAFLLLPLINLISINMSRIFERASEIGVRKAFGASSLHLVGQFIVENVVLCMAGGVLALLGAYACQTIINTTDIVPMAGFGFNWRVFLYALLLSGFFGVLSGAYPAWRMSRIHPVAALRGGVR